MSDSSDEESFSEDDSNESQNNYEKDDFVVSDSEVSDENFSVNDAKNPSKKKRKSVSPESRSSNSQAPLAKRPQLQSQKKRLKKIKRSDDEDSQKLENEVHPELVNSQEDLEADEEEGSDFQEGVYRAHKPKVLDRIFDEFNIEREERKRREDKETDVLNVGTIDDVFEPADLIQNYETPADKLIVQTDVPERLQLLYKYRDVPDSDELVLESEWLCKQLSHQKQLNEAEGKSLIPRIRKILEYLRVGNCEIMYIWTYKQQEFTLDPKAHPGHYKLKLTDLWALFELDQDWKDVFSKSQAINKLYDLLAMHQHVSPQVTTFKSKCFVGKQLDFLIEYGIHHIRKFITFEELKNSLELLNIKGACSSLLGNKTVAYEMHRFGLNKIAESFTLTADQLATNLTDNTRTFKPPMLSESPVDLSKKCIREEFFQFKDSTSVFQAILSHLAYEYFVHPVVRKTLYHELRSLVTLNTEPTDKGKSLTVYDYFYPAKRVANKRIDDKINKLWLLITEAETKGLVKIEFKYDYAGHSHGKNAIRNRLVNHLLASSDSQRNKDVINDQWDRVREVLIDRLIDDHLLPDFHKCLRQELDGSAEKYVYNKCAGSLKEMINTKPYRVRDHHTNSTEPTSVLACSNSDTSALFVVLKETGEVHDFFEAKNILRKGAEEDKVQQSLYKRDLETLANFIGTHCPGVIVVAPKNLRSHNLKMELRNIAESVAKTADVKEPFVMWGNLQVSFSFAQSSLSDKLMQGYGLLFKEAVSAGRFIQNPLAETLNIWSENEKTNAVIQLNLHQFQHLTNPYKLKNKLENLLVELVNSVGVDVHSCLHFPHLTNQLQFVCGFGPRKATKLLERLRAENLSWSKSIQEDESIKPKLSTGALSKRNLERNLEDTQRRVTANDSDSPHLKSSGFLNRRSFLIEEDRLRHTVYVNAIGFLKCFNRSDFHSAEEFSEDYEWLDFTRIHPDDYQMAKKIASSPFEGRYASENVAVLNILKNSAKLDDYNLEEYGKHLSDMLNANMVAVVDFIINELKHPFADDRPDFPTKQENQEIFYRLSGESRYKFMEHAIITAKLIAVSDMGLKVLTSSDLIGMVKLSDAKEDGQETDVKTSFVIGNYVRAKIKRINYDKLILDLTLRQRDLTSHNEYLRQNKILDKFDLADGHGFKVIKELDYPKSAVEIRQKVKRFVTRKINHPYFKNIGVEKAQEFLADRTRGEFLFRPSSKGTDFINITWRLFDNTYVHLVVKEGFKTSSEELSKSLTLDKQEYDSIDSIISNYLRPCNKQADNIILHDKFSLKGIEHAKSLLIEKKQANPSMIPYNFTVSNEYPQFVILNYAANKLLVKHELIKIKPRGLFFHSQFFSNLDYIVKFFKENLKSKEYLKFVDSVPKIDFGVKEKKEEIKEDAYVKEEGQRRRTYRNESVKREHYNDSRVKQEFQDAYSNRKVDVSVKRYNRQRDSDSSLEFNRNSPQRKVKKEFDAGPKIEGGYFGDSGRGGANSKSSGKIQTMNFESADN